MDSGWVAFGVVAAVAVLVAVVMIGVSAASQPADDRLWFTSDEVEFAYPSDWSVSYDGCGDSPDHRVVAHIVTFEIDPEQRFADSCDLTGGAIPPGEASIVITAQEGGTPPVPEPVTARPFGLDADALIGGKPAVFESRQSGDDTIIAWWQLSPSGFLDRWIEVAPKSLVCAWSRPPCWTRSGRCSTLCNSIPERRRATRLAGLTSNDSRRWTSSAAV